MADRFQVVLEPTSPSFSFNVQLNRLDLERQRKRQSELKLLLGQQISGNVNR
jgi:hypothetical protein